MPITVRRPGQQLEVLPFLVFIFLLGFVNSLGRSMFNNAIIAVIELAFVLWAVTFFVVPGRWLTRVMVVLLAMGGLLGLSNGWAQYDAIRYADWMRVYQMLAHAGFLFAVGCFVAGHKQAPLAVAQVFAAGVIVYFCVWLAAWYGLDDPFNFDWFNAPPLFAHIRHLGYFLGATSVVLAWAVLAFAGVYRGVFLVCFCLALSLLLWSGSRGSCVSALVGLLVFAFGFRGRCWWLLLAAVVASLWFSAQFPVAQDELGWMSALLRSGGAGSVDELSTGRVGIWMYLLPFILERPLLGWGGEGFQAVWQGYPIIQAHNGVFQLLIEWGALGAVFVSGGLAIILCKAVRQYLSGSAEEGLLLGFGLSAAMLALSVIDGVFYHGTPMAYLMLGVGICFSCLLGKSYQQRIGR